MLGTGEDICDVGGVEDDEGRMGANGMEGDGEEDRGPVAGDSDTRPEALTTTGGGGIVDVGMGVVALGLGRSSVALGVVTVGNWGNIALAAREVADPDRAWPSACRAGAE